MAKIKIDAQIYDRAKRAAEAAGADALLVVSPYYNKPNRTGMINHYRAVCESTALPVVVYNVPGRTGQNLGTELILELAAMDGVAGVKEASGDLEQLAGDQALVIRALKKNSRGRV